MTWTEHPLLFECEGDRLIGIVTQPGDVTGMADTGVLIVVGGPQYRAGSHRQFTLLARQLAGQGIASFRFDYRGMGDSEGDMRNFEHIDADIRAAVDAFMARLPALAGVAIWGLCDAASAALFYGQHDPRVRGLVLLNPWVHTESAEAVARLRRYYPARLLSYGFWRKLLRLEINLRKAFEEMFGFIRLRKRRDDGAAAEDGFVQRMREGAERFPGELLIVLSGKDDLTAQEFRSLLDSDPKWQRVCQGPAISSISLHAANHTFAREEWRNQVGAWTAGWLLNRAARAGSAETPAGRSGT